MLNPYAPPGLQGIDPSAPAGYFDKPTMYPYNVVLTANQALVGQIVKIFTEADFILRGVILAQSTGTFSIQWQDGFGYYLQSGQVFNTNLPSTPGDPFPVFPEVLYPAGGQIWIDITDTSGAGNTIQVVFVGVNRYRQAKMSSTR